MEPPPQYSVRDSGQHDPNQQRERLEQIQNLNLQACPHPHELLVSIMEGSQSPPPTVLHHWDYVHTYSQTAGHLNLPVDLTEGQFKLIQGFQDLGTFQLPASKISGDDGLHHFLMSIVMGSKENGCAVSSDSQVISFIISHLHKLSESEPHVDQVSVQLFTIPVLGTDPHALIADGAFPAWKWFRQNKTYRRIEQGFWKPELADVILHGDSCMGGALSLLVQGVSADRKVELRERMVIFPASG